MSRVGVKRIFRFYIGMPKKFISIITSPAGLTIKNFFHDPGIFLSKPKHYTPSKKAVQSLSAPSRIKVDIDFEILFHYVDITTQNG